MVIFLLPRYFYINMVYSSDQSLCWSRTYSMTAKLLGEHHLELLSLKGGCICSTESTEGFGESAYWHILISAYTFTHTKCGSK